MLELRNITFSYDDSPAVENLSVSVAKGTHLAIIGESGSGKSTLLKIIYGQFDLDSGDISYEGKPILGPKFNLIPGDDRFKYLAQDFGLMPYITAAENVGKFLSNIYKDKKLRRISELLEMVEMTEYANVKVQYLSGGQQQRIAIAKAIALEPEVLLLDEPFSQIDNFRANTLKRNLFKYFKEKNISCIVATHDGGDVLSYADETLIMKDGRVHEYGRPKSIYAAPGSKYVASLFGEVNEIPPGKFGSTEIQLVYPHQLKISAGGIRAIVNKSYFKGSHYLIEASYEGGTLFFENRVPILEKEGVFLTIQK